MHELLRQQKKIKFIIIPYLRSKKFPSLNVFHIKVKNLLFLNSKQEGLSF